ncbi:hypothetical protein VTK56DRAFT_7886 [Thermocarpiscus australiensis]
MASCEDSNQVRFPLETLNSDTWASIYTERFSHDWMTMEDSQQEASVLLGQALALQQNHEALAAQSQLQPHPELPFLLPPQPDLPLLFEAQPEHELQDLLPPQAELPFLLEPQPEPGLQFFLPPPTELQPLLQHQQQQQQAQLQPQYYPSLADQWAVPDFQQNHHQPQSPTMLVMGQENMLLARPPQPKPRLSKEELDVLEGVFASDPKPTTSQKKDLAARLNLDVPRVNVGFTRAFAPTLSSFC